MFERRAKGVVNCVPLYHLITKNLCELLRHFLVCKRYLTGNDKQSPSFMLRFNDLRGDCLTHSHRIVYVVTITARSLSLTPQTGFDVGRRHQIENEVG
ncbi:hypothetical protein YC2023_071253 [Brassica napus]